MIDDGFSFNKNFNKGQKNVAETFSDQLASVSEQSSNYDANCNGTVYLSNLEVKHAL